MEHDEGTGAIRAVGKHDQQAAETERVKVAPSRAHALMLLARAVVAGVAAFAGALATASLGSDSIQAPQYWAAVAAGAVSVGVVIGVPDAALNTRAPRGELDKMKREQGQA